MTEVELAAVGGAAVLAGAVNALAGGGTLITFPVLMALGVPALAANVTNTVALCPGYLGGALAQAPRLRGDRRRMCVFGLAGALGGLGGGLLLLHSGQETFRALVPYLILVASGLLAAEAPVRRWQERHSSPGEGRPALGAGKVVPVFLASIYGGYFGAGLSVIVLAVLALISRESLTRLNALKQVIALCANVAAAVLFIFSGRIVWPAAVVMAVGALAGGAIGGRLADRVPPQVLRGIVVAFGVVVAAIYFVR
jgi:uncharacterized membrane protein YfcA